MKRFRLVLLSLVVGLHALAQTDSVIVRSVNLPTTEIRTVSDYPDAALSFEPDSLIMLTAKGGSLGDLLMLSSAVNLRTYGPQGTLITAGGRGLSADHVQVYWMGVSLNSPSLGLTDLSAIPFSLFDGVRMQSGTSLSRSQAGAAAGAIHLTSIQSESIEAGVAYNALNNRSHWLRISQTYFKRLRARTRVSIDRAENDFSFRDPFLVDQPERQQNRNNFARNALIQEFSYTFRPNLTIEAGLWLQASQLEVPELMGGYSQQVTDQRDSSLRMNISANWVTSLGKFTLRTARFNEHQLYRQSQSIEVDPHIVSNISTQRSTAHLSWLKHYRLFDVEAGVDYQNEAVESANHSKNVAQRELLGIQGRMIYTSAEARISIAAASRYDAGIAGNQPIFDLKLNWNLDNRLSVFTLGRRIFRYPDLNELHWTPGGNPNISPEIGWAIDAGGNLNFKKDNLSGQFSVSGFLQAMDNLIVWLSDDGAVQARNVSNVQSAGIESTAALRWELNKLVIKQNLHLILQKHNGLSALERSFFPQIQGNYNASISRNALFIGATIRAAATTFVPENINATHGSQDAVLIADFQIGKTFDCKVADVNLAATCRNIADVLDYRTSRFASPGRVFGVQMNVNLKSRKISRVL